MSAPPLLVTQFKLSKNQKAVVGTYIYDCGYVNLNVSAVTSLHPLDGGLPITSASFGLHKPESFFIGYHLPTKNVTFQVMNNSLLDKKLKWKYSHNFGNNRKALNGRLAIDSANTFSATYAFGSAHSKLNHTYVHNNLTEIEQSYNFGDKSFNLAVSRKLSHTASHKIRVSYNSATKLLGMDWWISCLKVSASLSLNERLTFPRITAEAACSVYMPATNESTTCDINYSE